jgi:hypothetical protein
MTEQPTTSLADELEAAIDDCEHGNSARGKKHLAAWAIRNRTRLLSALRNQQAPSPEGVEPDAMRYDFDGYGYQYIDSGSGSDWRTRHADAEPLFASHHGSPTGCSMCAEALALSEERERCAKIAESLTGITPWEVAKAIRSLPAPPDDGEGGLDV